MKEGWLFSKFSCFFSPAITPLIPSLLYPNIQVSNLLILQCGAQVRPDHGVRRADGRDDRLDGGGRVARG